NVSPASAITGRAWRASPGQAVVAWSAALGFSESFNGKLRDECLNSHVFASVAEAQVVLDAWREDYNAVRPHTALQDRTPAAVGAMWVDQERRDRTRDHSHASVAFQM